MMTSQPESDPHRNALVVRGGWPGHMPVEATDLFIPFLRKNGFEVRVDDSTAAYADEDFLATVDLIVQSNTMTAMSPAESRGLRSAVENGTGLAGWHGGIADSYRADADYLHLIGGQFAAHPGKHPEQRVGDASDNYLPHTIEMTQAAAEHPITRGIVDFDLVTEQYWVLHDDYNDVLATTTLAAREWDPWNRPVVSPVVWTRQWGLGRIFVSTPGHSTEILLDPNVRTITERGLLWASR